VLEIEPEDGQQQRDLAESRHEQPMAVNQDEQELGESQQRDLLELLKDELTACRSMLENRIKHPENLHVQPFKSSFWHAAIAAGKMRFIQSTRLLNSLSSVYYQIDTVRRIEEQGYQSAHHAVASLPESATVTEQLWRDARSFDESLSRDLEQALYLIEQELKKIPV